MQFKFSLLFFKIMTTVITHPSLFTSSRHSGENPGVYTTGRLLQLPLRNYSARECLKKTGQSFKETKKCGSQGNNMYSVEYSIRIE